MKPFRLGYQKINTCLNFYMLHYLKNIELIKCRICKYTHYKPRTSRGKTFVVHRKLRYFLITPRL